MLGGIGYFYGQSKIKAPKSTQVIFNFSCFLALGITNQTEPKFTSTKIDPNVYSSKDPDPMRTDLNLNPISKRTCLLITNRSSSSMFFSCRLKVRMSSCYIGQLNCTQQFQAGQYFLEDFCGTKVFISCWSG